MIETRMLRELIYQDVSSYPNSLIGDIHQRIGTEIPNRKQKAQLYNMLELRELNTIGKQKGIRIK